MTTALALLLIAAAAVRAAQDADPVRDGLYAMMCADSATVALLDRQRGRGPLRGRRRGRAVSCLRT